MRVVTLIAFVLLGACLVSAQNSTAAPTAPPTLPPTTVTNCDIQGSAVNEGDPCNPNTGPLCKYGLDCVANTGAVNGQGTCQIAVGYLSPCGDQARCESAGLVCINSRCRAYRYAGESCTINGTNPLCLSSACTAGVCTGLAQGFQGANCVSNNPCGRHVAGGTYGQLACTVNQPLFPMNGTCTAPLAEGAACLTAAGGALRPFHNRLTACQSGLVCDKLLGVCTRPFSRAAGEQSELASGCQLVDGPSLAFDGTQCYANCGTNPTADPLCNNGVSCQCTPGAPTAGGSCTDTTCKTFIEEVFMCAQNSSCITAFTGPRGIGYAVAQALTTGTCMNVNCQEKVFRAECCVTSFGTNGRLTPGVDCSSFNGTPLPTAASSVWSSQVVVLLTMAVVGLVAYFAV